MTHTHHDTSTHFIEGISNDLVFLLIGSTIFVTLVIIILKMFRSSRDIHPRHLEQVQEIRQRVLEARGETPEQHPSHRNADDRCPICIDGLKFAVETNCAHIFCCSCIISYWEHGSSMSAMQCPICRQEVRVLLPDFTHEEEVSDNVNEQTNKIRLYNRRFSGEPRPLLEYILDFPVLLRHMFRNFFNVNGLVAMLRVRIVVYLAIVVLYILSPLDIIPEFVFGILGFLDDIAIAGIILLYLTVLFRQSLANH